MFRNMMFVVLAVLSCIQLVVGGNFEYTPCNPQRLLYTYNKKSPFNVDINGVVDYSYISCPLGDFLKFDMEVVDDKIIEMGSSDLVDTLQKIPTSDKSDRVDRNEFYTTGADGNDTFSKAFGIIPVWEDPTEIPTFISQFFVSQKNINPRPILNWVAGSEWAVDYTADCQDFQGFYNEIGCTPNPTTYCSVGQNTVTKGSFGSIGSGNSLLRQITEDLECSNKVTFEDAPQENDNKIAITVYTFLEDGDSLKIFDGPDASATLLREYTYGDALFTQDVLYTSQPNNFYTEFYTDNSNFTARGNGFTIVYSRVNSSLGEQDNCFAPSQTCRSQCHINLVSSYELAFAADIEPNFDYRDCLDVYWSEECVLAAYTIELTGVCGNLATGQVARSINNNGFFLGKKASPKIASTDKSKRSVHLEKYAASLML